MAFLDNSGDIILDAVLTDTGRLRLARGDGSFKITKFAFGDDEVNYGLYDKNNTSGSAYYDLDILQMPVFEAFTNNTSVLKYPLLSISKTNLLYLPVLKIATATNGETNNTSGFTAIQNVNGYYVVSSDTTTNTTKFDDNQIDGVNSSTRTQGIKIDQGIDNSAIGIDEDGSGTGTQLASYGLRETQYMIMMDNRLGTILGTDGLGLAPSFIDDDNIATYFISEASNTSIIDQINSNPSDTSDAGKQIIAGPRGTTVCFLIKASTLLQTSTDLFTKLGGEVAGVKTPVNTYYYIDTNVVVKGVTTGSSITVPVRFVKFKS